MQKACLPSVLRPSKYGLIVAAGKENILDFPLGLPALVAEPSDSLDATEYRTVGEQIVIPVIREDWHLEKEVRETGKVYIRKLVHEREELIEDSLATDGVDVEHVAMDRVVESVPPIRTEGGVTVIPVVKEFLVVTKQLKLVEEIRVSRVKSSIPFQQSVTLRSEEVVVDRSPTGYSDANKDSVEFTETAEHAVVTKPARIVEEVSIGKNITERTDVVKDTVRHTEVETEKFVADDTKVNTASGQ